MSTLQKIKRLLFMNHFILKALSKDSEKYSGVRQVSVFGF